MAKKLVPLAEAIYRLQLSLVRRLNDTHIFVHQALPLLMEARASYEASNHSHDRKYYVPSTKKSSVANRTDAELKEIYDHFLTRELFATLLIASVSQTESFLFDSLRLVLRRYPKKLGLNVQGLAPERSVPLDSVLGAKDLPALTADVVESRLSAVTYAAPSVYLAFFKAVTGIDTSEKAFQSFIEIKATRDVLIHNSGLANAIYATKAGARARARPGDPLPVTQEYFDASLAILKRVAGIVSRDAKVIFTS